ncbi:hypothetical protein GALMADRAFT_461721 [Galerina marginata CBS 339.88]|uniref:Uncharacterized protein n=1 Tax=Galerina marginata (strain CBS 339.88) TaxID=685588 RepID=A0A067SYZ8_GALM3|nr:hypothetical protein GALMADRAFT_461721 [Galerina marginata CBS 339.88]
MHFPLVDIRICNLIFICTVSGTIMQSYALVYAAKDKFSESFFETCSTSELITAISVGHQTKSCGSAYTYPFLELIGYGDLPSSHSYGVHHYIVNIAMSGFTSTGHAITAFVGNAIVVSGNYFLSSSETPFIRVLGLDLEFEAHQ